ncbi:hypothetical protein HMPREF0868_0479 [Mageeibacillus indolicus UPII9-5]|uniref:Uncharacterized protein n=1 Tax=Mageeibacillus indolicus (strain UPII9-5) TaxID=699246 RepID=D3R0V3_MAGIU|nr:hypothetical protein HMPREF0868_0479 [Mageeibacillus indolicus UPII9-5]
MLENAGHHRICQLLSYVRQVCQVQIMLYKRRSNGHIAADQ